ncbi:hypothetical protein LWI28_023919 [Acer negundo]|uniref:Uncharacterized protein n=1 Tax=Acer negundo TaxID=4023 RepID=A0AAD5NVF7_ACENE|nr:hypothetical protein LWI28_023919 [Acer negundo]
MGRSPCCEKAHTNKGAWTKEEDDRLIAYIRAHGEGCWRSLPKAAGLLRCGKSCRLRWINYLRPDLKRGNFTDEEDELIIKLHSLLGNKWSLIAGRLPGRTDNEIKNYWNTHIRRKLLTRGIDPATHRPLNEPPSTTPSTTTTSTTNLQDVTTTTTTISFSASAAAAASTDQKDHNNNNNNNNNKQVVQVKHEMMRCPDLNLDLKISPPMATQQQQKQSAETLKKNGGGMIRELCFACNLGLQNSKDCSCSCSSSFNIVVDHNNTSSINGGSSSNNNNTCYDFLGLKTSVLDYRSLEMK